MPRVRGFFDNQGFGTVVARMVIFNAAQEFAATFRIDTASYWTLLVDYDFLFACHLLGWDPTQVPDLLNWIRMQPDTFTHIGDGIGLAGDTGPIFRIEHSYLWLCQPNLAIPRGWLLQSPVYATLTPQFLSGQAPSHTSLLGIDRINELGQLVYSYPNSRIVLTR